MIVEVLTSSHGEIHIGVIAIELAQCPSSLGVGIKGDVCLRAGQTRQNTLAQMIESQTDLTNLTENASLHSRLPSG